jgi:hypothetical protein
MLSTSPILSVCGRAETLNPTLRTPSNTSPNDVYRGTVVLPGGRERASAYIKVFPPGTRHQGVYNEVIAHHLALQCQLPSPTTFPCACPVSLLLKGSRETMAPGGRYPFVLGVASFDGSHKGIKQNILESPAQLADLLNWPHAARLAVFDELLGNDDRHLGNLVRCGPHDYLLIDNERILFGEPWFERDLTQLQTRYCDANALATTIAEATDEVMTQRMMSIAQHFVSQTLLVVPEIAARLEQISMAPVGVTTQLIDLLNDRRTRLRGLMHHHLRKGDLFQARTNR